LAGSGSSNNTNNINKTLKGSAIIGTAFFVAFEASYIFLFGVLIHSQLNLKFANPLVTRYQFLLVYFC